MGDEQSYFMAEPNILFTKWAKSRLEPPNAEFAHLFIHAGAGDAEGAGCLGDVPVVIAEGDEDGLRFAVLDDGLEFPVRAPPVPPWLAGGVPGAGRSG